ncbi:MAG TPA: hypothetical protein VFM53_05545 [Anaeromyxobacteraceae bacterium]|nr:hypothetical protein [Anaeromyxobacteraceae bacterium]
MSNAHPAAAHRRPAFPHRLARAGLLAGAIVALSLGIGMLGYRVLAGLDWDDAFLNAAMILSGMGPVAPLHTVPAKLFAGTYALYSGLVFIASTGIILSPFMARVLHLFHAERDARRPG